MNQVKHLRLALLHKSSHLSIFHKMWYKLTVLYEESRQLPRNLFPEPIGIVVKALKVAHSDFWAFSWLYYCRHFRCGSSPTTWMNIHQHCSCWNERETEREKVIWTMEQCKHDFTQTAEGAGLCHQTHLINCVHLTVISLFTCCYITYRAVVDVVLYCITCKE